MTILCCLSTYISVLLKQMMLECRVLVTNRMLLICVEETGKRYVIESQLCAAKG